MSLQHPWTRTLAACAGALFVAAALGACAVQPFRPFMKATHPITLCDTAQGADPRRTTPEVAAQGAYTLHFVEFDDQGWSFPDPGEGPGVGTPSRQIDCAITDLRHTLEEEDRGSHKGVLALVYVHGWKHSAADDDRDVKRFRTLLQSRAKANPERRIVGIYVGWQGNTLDIPGVRNLTFWGRKNAAHHVSEGRVRELFSRLHGLRAYWNGPRHESEHPCDWEPGTTDRCKLRTIMIGHSFGGLILYNSAAPYLLEMLSMDRDLPASEKRPRAARARSIADLIVLLNPAFEGSRYEALFEASRHYQALADEPPVLVTLTSTADWATKNAFPVARWFNSIFQYPASSDAQSEAMRRTPGHIDRYLSHRLCGPKSGCTGGDAALAADGTRLAAAGPGMPVSADGPRRYCGDLVLQPYEWTRREPRSIVWNVRTDESLIAGHNDIDGDEVIGFIARVYAEVTGRRNPGCSEDYGAAPPQTAAADVEVGVPPPP